MSNRQRPGRLSRPGLLLGMRRGERREDTLHRGLRPGRGGRGGALYAAAGLAALAGGGAARPLTAGGPAAARRLARARAHFAHLRRPGRVLVLGLYPALRAAGRGAGREGAHADGQGAGVPAAGRGLRHDLCASGDGGPAGRPGSGLRLRRLHGLSEARRQGGARRARELRHGEIRLRDGHLRLARHPAAGHPEGGEQGPGPGLAQRPQFPGGAGRGGGLGGGAALPTGCWRLYARAAHRGDGGPGRGLRAGARPG